MKHAASLILCCVSVFVACNQRKEGVPLKAIKLGGTYNEWNTCVGHASHLCGPERDEIRQMFTTAFAGEPGCHGIELQALTSQEESVPVKDISGYFMIMFLSPGQWSYQSNFEGKFLSRTVKDERELAQEVCRIAGGHGGSI
jgi:hypothetical protein